MLHVKLAPGLSRVSLKWEYKLLATSLKMRGYFLFCLVPSYHSQWKSPILLHWLKCFQIFLNSGFLNRTKNKKYASEELPRSPKAQLNYICKMGWSKFCSAGRVEIYRKSIRYRRELSPTHHGGRAEGDCSANWTLFLHPSPLSEPEASRTSHRHRLFHSGSPDSAW